MSKTFRGAGGGGDMTNVRHFPVVITNVGRPLKRDELEAALRALDDLVTAIDVEKPSWREQLDEARALLDSFRVSA